MTDTATEATASQPLTAPPVTCGTPSCTAALLDGFSYASTWARAVDSRWTTDATGQRRCPDCGADRVPAPGMYVPDAELGAWIASLDPEPEAPPLAVPAVPPVPSVLTAPAVPVIPEPDPGSVAELAAERHQPAAFPGLNPVQEQAMQRFTSAHDAEDAAAQEPGTAEQAAAGPDATAVIPATSAETEMVPAVTDEGDPK